MRKLGTFSLGDSRNRRKEIDKLLKIEVDGNPDRTAWKDYEGKLINVMALPEEDCQAFFPHFDRKWGHSGPAWGQTPSNAWRCGKRKRAGVVSENRNDSRPSEARKGLAGATGSESDTIGAPSDVRQ
jgi:hypothetical protein